MYPDVLHITKQIGVGLRTKNIVCRVRNQRGGGDRLMTLPNNGQWILGGLTLCVVTTTCYMPYREAHKNCHLDTGSLRRIANYPTRRHCFQINPPPTPLRFQIAFVLSPYNDLLVSMFYARNTSISKFCTRGKTREVRFRNTDTGWSRTMAIKQLLSTKKIGKLLTPN